MNGTDAPPLLLIDQANATDLPLGDKEALLMHAESGKHSRAVFALGIARITFGALFAACTSVRRTKESSDLARPEVERVSRGRVRIRWPASFTTGPVIIYAGTSPESIDRSVALAHETGDFVDLTTASHPMVTIGHRLYYELVAVEGGASMVTAERRLPLDGADNFRDLGGYRTADERFVRWGVLFRSNDIAGLTDRDVDTLSEIDMRLQCDLRSDSEREQRPNQMLRTPPHEVLEVPIRQLGMNPSEIREAIRKGDITKLGIRQKMLSTYRSFPIEYRDLWAHIFRRLEGLDSLPFLVNCTAGKDRTGFFSALVLLALGVPEHIVYEDYLATNQYRSTYNKKVLRWAPIYSLFRTNKEDLLPLLDARAEYLEASLQKIRNRWGSVNAYLEDEIGLTAERREALRANLLTSPRLRSVRDVAPAEKMNLPGRTTHGRGPAVRMTALVRPDGF